jgi:phosphate uptake regulator
MSIFFRLFRGESSTRLEEVSRKAQQMLANDRREFDLAMSALMGDVPWEEVNDEVRNLDREVNRLEREIRRHLLVHVSVFGAIETPAVLVYMSIVKDIERIGDYAKNLLDLARDGANLSTVERAEKWRTVWWEEVSELIGDAATAFAAWDTERSRTLLSRGDKLLKTCDARVSAIVRGEDQGEQAVARALALRFLKRVVAHVMNLLTAMVMPMHQLDYFDEDPEDRDDRMGESPGA